MRWWWLFCHSVLFDSLWPMDCSMPGFPILHHPGACLNSCPLNQWDHPTISSSLTHFFSCLQSFPASVSFPMSWLFASGGQSIGASGSVLPMSIQGWFPLGFTGWISLQSKGLSSIFSNSKVQKHQVFWVQPFLWSNSHMHTFLLKNHSFDYIKQSVLNRITLTRCYNKVLNFLYSPTITSIPDYWKNHSFD